MKKILSFIFIFLFQLVFLTSLSPAAETVCFYHTDAAGTPLAMTNASGAVVWKEVYRPFGEKQTLTGTATNTKQFIGKDKDPETGLHAVGVRYMKDETGRFVSPDPVGAVDPASGKINTIILKNPQRLNLYAYGLNNPYKYIDPDGRLTVNIWDYDGKNDSWGHASITLEDGTHISWWPSSNRDSKKLIPLIYSAPALDNQTMSKDILYEGKNPDHQIKITGLDEAKISTWWNDFKQNNEWKTLSQNCSTTTSDALKAGGGSDYSSWLKSHNIVWNPGDAKAFAREIKRNIGQQTKVP